MKIFKVELMDSWGYSSNEKYWDDTDKAISDFDGRIDDMKNSEYLASQDDLDHSNFIDSTKAHELCTKATTVYLWDSCMTDCGKEWDIKTVELILSEIEVN